MGPPFRGFGATLDVQGSLTGDEVVVVGDRTWSTTATGAYTTAALSDATAAGISGTCRKVVTTGGSG